MAFVEDHRLHGTINMWDKMTKVKLLSWNTSAKDLKLNIGHSNITLKATSSLFARMLVIAKSSREEVDLQEVIGMYEFSQTNLILMQTNGSIHPTTDKSTLIHILEDMAYNSQKDSIECIPNEDKCLIIDGMAVVQELMAVRDFRDGKEFASNFVMLVDSKGEGYQQVWLYLTTSQELCR